MEKRTIAIFDQFVPKWKNENDNEIYMVVNYLNLLDMEIRKTFIRRDIYLEKNIKGMFTKDINEVKVIEAVFETDENDHEHIGTIEVVKTGKIVM